MNDEKTTSAVLVPVARNLTNAREVAAREREHYFKPCPPEGQDKAVWLQRLKRALGTMSQDFVNATLIQIQHASRLPRGGISETSVNAVLAIIEGIGPKDELEATLAIQIACTHAVNMCLLANLGGAFGSSSGTAMTATATARLLKAFAAQVESLRRLRNGGSQVVRVEHVHINDGANAVIGNVGK